MDFRAIEEAGRALSHRSCEDSSADAPSAAAKPGEFVRERDVHQLYFFYITSSFEDWQYILESKGLGQHVDKFLAQEPTHGEQVHKLTLPDTGSIKVEATISQFENISAHLSFDEFSRVLETMLVTWDGYRRGYTKSHAHAEMTARVAMVTDLLSATSMSSSAHGFLASMQVPDSNIVYASVERGNVNPAVSNTVQRLSQSRSRTETSQRPFRCLAVYNGPVLVAVLEERQGSVNMFQPPCVAPRHERLVTSSCCKGTVYDAMTSQVIFEAVERCGNYSGLLQLLLVAGLHLAPTGSKNGDIMSSESKGGNKRASKGECRCFRLLQGALVVGCLWDKGGTMSCLRWQPSKDEFGQPWGTVCMYRDDNTQIYLKTWELYYKCGNVKEFLDALVLLGLTTEQIKYEALFLPHQ